jgi:hypothetical protein
MRVWYLSHAEQHRETARRSRRRRIEAARAYDRARGYRVYDPEKVEARKAVYLAVMSGVLTRQPCEECGETKVDGHHEDYSRPLEVRWLCRQHHLALHRRIAA